MILCADLPRLLSRLLSVAHLVAHLGAGKQTARPAFPLVGLLGSVSTQSAPEGIRTPNLLIRSQMLYPLSYGRPPRRTRREASQSLAGTLRQAKSGASGEAGTLGTVQWPPRLPGGTLWNE